MGRKKGCMAAIFVGKKKKSIRNLLLVPKRKKNNNPDMPISKTRTKAWTFMNCLESWKQKYFS